MGRQPVCPGGGGGVSRAQSFDEFCPTSSPDRLQSRSANNRANGNGRDCHSRQSCRKTRGSGARRRMTAIEAPGGRGRLTRVVCIEERRRDDRYRGGPRPWRSLGEVVSVNRRAVLAAFF